MILVDEAQDLSTAQLSNLKQLAKHNQVVYFLGEHQIIYDSVSKFHFLEQLFFHDNQTPMQLLQLPSCYRNPLPILRIINKLIEIKCQLTGGLLDKHESSVLELAKDHQIADGDVQWLSPEDEKLKTMVMPYLDSPHFAVIVNHESDAAEALEFLGCPPEKIFPKASCKGFQFKYVLLWKPLQSEKLRQLDKKIGEPLHLGVEDAKVFHRAKNKSLDDQSLIVFNQLIIAFSRSTELIIMVEHQKFHPQQNLIDGLMPLFNPKSMIQGPSASSIEDWIGLVINFLKENRKKEAQAIYDRHLSGLYSDFSNFCEQHGFAEPKLLPIPPEPQKSPDALCLQDKIPSLNIVFEDALFNSRPIQV